MRRVAAPAMAAVCAVALAGCDDDSNILSPRSGAARDISTLWWWMLAAATIVFLGAVGLVGAAWVLRRRQGAPLLGDSEGRSRGLVLLFGIAIPFVALIAVFTVANFVVASGTDASAEKPRSLRIAVVGRQWWWQVRYPGTAAVTANEIHIPVRTHVRIDVTSADVIHSFWVPRLNRKIDLIPGDHNSIDLYADRPDRYEGQCAEFCGLQHANMRFTVIAQPRDAYDAWLRKEAGDAAAPTGAEATRGKALLEANACASCHQIRGTSARGQVGPDLTHLADRHTLAAVLIPNTPHALSVWVRDPQHVKPGNQMPGLHLSRGDFDAIVAYLRELR